MSSTLVETVPIPPPHTLYVETPTISGFRHTKVLSSNETLATQLARLASQHQTSEYNRLKFGPKGAPVKYIPLSVHMPDHVRQLKARQIRYAGERSWWFSEKHPSESRTKFPSVPQLTSHDVDLTRELSAAMESPLSSSPALNAQYKTSETHPINVSIVIPLEILPVISFNLVQARKPSPVLYDIPPSCLLDKVTSCAYPTQTSPPIMTSIPRMIYRNPSPSNPALFWDRASVAQALQVAMNTGLQEISQAPSLPISRTCSYRSQNSTEFDQDQEDSEIGMAPKPVKLPPTPPLKSRRSFPMLGNLYLSSCPGKKVRLSGPVNGRVGVCRDLGRDLSRVKELGVGCIVCCLDDSELEYLGVSWSDYARIAHDKGLDVLRVPTPEGLAPLEPGILDSYLMELIDTYTLQGIPILVHCRGGVGRAGLIACCWILKLGLCGWIDTYPSSSSLSLHPEGPIRRDTLQLVEKAIMVIRRRRSVKAVETFEQVLFLVEYVEYLRKCGSASLELSDNHNDK